MKKIVLTCLLVFCAATAMAQPSPVKPPMPQDFKFGNELIVNGKDAVAEVVLPDAVYRGVAHPDASDVRVFNAHGDVVPFSISEAETETNTTMQIFPLRFFPIVAHQQDGVATMSVKILKSGNGSFFAVDSDQPANGKSLATQTIGYVVDVSALGDPKLAWHAFTFDWTFVGKSFVQTINVDTSDDLETWRSLVSGATLARFRHDGQELTRDRVEFFPTATKYLRITWSNTGEPLVLNSIKGEMVGYTSQEAVLVPVRVDGKIDPKDPKSFIFDTGGFFPAQRAHFILPQPNTWIRANLYASDTPEGAWELESRAIFYRLTVNGHEIIDSDQIVYSRHRYWKLKLEQEEGGIGTGVPTLELFWKPQVLSFLVQGDGPFLLAYGSRKIGAADFPVHDLAQKFGVSDAKNQRVTIGLQKILRDAALDVVPKETGIPKKWILWGALLTGVLVLAVLSVKLMRQMSADPK